MRITPQYENFLARFVRAYPAFFWQFNFWGIVGGIAFGLDVISLVLPSSPVEAPWLRLLLYLVVASVGAQLIQHRYKRRAKHLEHPMADASAPAT